MFTYYSAGLRVAGALALLLILTSPILADFASDYEDALAAIKQGRWAQAQSHLSDAIGKRSQAPRSGKVRLYGMRSVFYIPYYYLGAAAFERDDCETALQEWATAVRHQVVQRTPQFATLEDNRDVCSIRIASKTKPEIVVDGLAPPPVQESGSEGPTQRFPRLRSARAALVDRLRPGNRQAPPETVEVAEDIKVTEGIEVADGAGESPLDEEPSTPPEPPGPPERLQAAAGAYFEGDFERTVTILAANSFDPLQERRAGAWSRLFQAAARYSQYLEQGRTDTVLRNQAIADIKACRGLDPTLLPDGEAFSPGFIAFFLEND